MPATVDSTAKANFTCKLESIQKLDKNQFISSFIDTQSLHATYYAEEGRTLWNDLDDSLNPNPTNPPQFKELTVSGFSTPVLIPRNPKASITKDLNLPNPNPNTKSPLKKAKSKEKSSSRAKSDSRSRDHLKNVSLTKKRTEKPDDDETAARLAERRDRKRAKREIVRPIANDNADCKDDSKQTGAAREKKGKQKKASSQNAPGLALMHGFTATNVGKKRLTVPPPTLGVFKKGKASTRTQVSKKPAKAMKPPAFLESIFLKGTSRHPKLIANEPPSDDSSSEEEESTSTNLLQKKTQKVRNSSIKARSRSSTTSSASSSNHDGTQSPIVRAESEVWDIEREGFNLSSIISKTSPERNQSVILNTRSLPWGSKAETMEVNRKMEALAPEQDIASQLSSSLAPSQSASQHGLTGGPTNRIPLLASKYFMPQQSHPFPNASPRDTKPPLSSPPRTPPLQEEAKPPVFTCENVDSEYFLDLPVAPNVHPNTSFHLPHQADGDIYHPYMAPSITGASPWDSFGSSDLVHFSDIDIIQLPSPDIYSHNPASSISYPYDFYIPPRVDAPPLQNDSGDADGVDSMFLFDRDGRGSMDWTPQQMLCDGYDDEEYLQFYDSSEYFTPQSQQPDAQHEDTTDQNDWEYEEDFCSVQDNEYNPLFGMDVEEGDILRCPSGEWIEPHGGDGTTSEINGDGSVIEEMPRFLQGRELLMGLSSSSSRQEALTQNRSGYVSTAEADVARKLKDHWRPQRL
ncbi:hypothetical protein J3R30DRAFT_3859332 [Lentinula aciculospora]|uniref:Uncharacterized protein n=1 Tax=Lentinula aciculospora TaxID=153920 RepID=A0A9W8ZUI2_9AGAR|nr:hypothetical protein J3R30DRAFT_3859332 [Lentinula aciculospora]